MNCAKTHFRRLYILLYLNMLIIVPTFLQIAIVMPAEHWLVSVTPQQELVFARKVLEECAVINAFLGKTVFKYFTPLLYVI